MKIPKVAQIVWLLKKTASEMKAVGFIRDHHDGFYIVNDATGSYYSGHDEFWKDKWAEYLNKGYLPEETVKEQGVVDDDWTPPSITTEDYKLIKKIEANVL